MEILLCNGTNLFNKVSNFFINYLVQHLKYEFYSVKMFMQASFEVTTATETYSVQSSQSEKRTSPKWRIQIGHISPV